MIMHHIIAMKRSGQHGVINWLKAQYEDAGHTVKVYNNSGVNVLKRAAGQMSQWVYPCYDLHRREGTSPRQIVINNYEDEYATQVIPQVMAYASCPPFESYDHWFWVNLRDPYNCFASRFRSPDVRAWVEDAVMRKMWVDHATVNNNNQYRTRYKKELMGHHRHMKMVEVKDISGEPPSVGYILFNKWFESRGYRDTLAGTLGLKNNDRGREKIGKYPSSFDGSNYEGNASQMKVLERWKEYEHDVVYKQQLTPEIMNLATRWFGESTVPDQLGLKGG